MISQALLDEVISQTEQSVLDDALIARLREAHPGISFTWCFDDDIVANAKAVVEKPTFKIYLVDSSDHCSVLTNCTDSASGMVLAEICPD